MQYQGYFEMYKIYCDISKNKMVYIRTNKQIPTNYDEYSDVYIEDANIGSNLISFLDLDYDSIIKLFKKQLANNSENIDDFFDVLDNEHEYFSCYIADFTRNALSDSEYYDVTEWSSLIRGYLDDFIDTIDFIKHNIIDFINNSKDNSLTLSQYYFLNSTNSQKASHKTNTLYSYNATIECLINNETDILLYEINDYQKILFNKYLEDNQQTIEQKYKIDKDRYDSGNEEMLIDYNEKGAFYDELDSEFNDTKRLTYKRFLQSEYIDFVYNNHQNIKSSYIEYLAKYKISLVDCIIPESIKEIISFELINLIKSNSQIKQCLNCGKLFIPSGEYDTKYCNRIFKDGLSCKVIGGRKTTYTKIESTPALKLYDRFYKRYKARIRNGKMSQLDFNSWNKTAKFKRDQCLNNEISFEEFSTWLNSIN